MDIKEEIRDLIENIRPSSEEQIIRRIKSGSFAKIIIWLTITSYDNDFVCVKDLAKFMRVSVQRARYILEDLVKFELLKRNKISGCGIDYHFTTDEYGKIKVTKYFEEARISLGLKIKVKMEVEEDGNRRNESKT